MVRWVTGGIALLLYVFGFSLVAARADACVGGECGSTAAEAVVVSAPEDASAPARRAPLARSDSASIVPTAGVIAGLAIVGLTLTHIAVRRRSELVVHGPAIDILISAGSTHGERQGFPPVAVRLGATDTG